MTSKTVSTKDNGIRQGFRKVYIISFFSLCIQGNVGDCSLCGLFMGAVDEPAMFWLYDLYWSCFCVRPRKTVRRGAISAVTGNYLFNFKMGLLYVWHFQVEKWTLKEIWFVKVVYTMGECKQLNQIQIHF